MGTSKTLDFYEITVARQIELYTQTEYWVVALWKVYFGHKKEYELIWEEETRNGYDTDTVLNGKTLEDLLNNACQIIKRRKMTHFSHDYEQGIKDERERIIKLIEENMDHWDGWLDVKELIKGEQK